LSIKISQAEAACVVDLSHSRVNYSLTEYVNSVPYFSNRVKGGFYVFGGFLGAEISKISFPPTRLSLFFPFLPFS